MNRERRYTLSHATLLHMSDVGMCNEGRTGGFLQEPLANKGVIIGRFRHNIEGYNVFEANSGIENLNRRSDDEISRNKPSLETGNINRARNQIENHHMSENIIPTVSSAFRPTPFVNEQVTGGFHHPHQIHSGEFDRSRHQSGVKERGLRYFNDDRNHTFSSVCGANGNTTGQETSFSDYDGYTRHNLVEGPFGIVVRLDQSNIFSSRSILENDFRSGRNAPPDYTDQELCATLEAKTGDHEVLKQQNEIAFLSETSDHEDFDIPSDEVCKDDDFLDSDSSFVSPSDSFLIDWISQAVSAETQRNIVETQGKTTETRRPTGPRPCQPSRCDGAMRGGAHEWVKSVVSIVPKVVPVRDSCSTSEIKWTGKNLEAGSSPVNVMENVSYDISDGPQDAPPSEKESVTQMTSTDEYQGRESTGLFLNHSKDLGGDPMEPSESARATYSSDATLFCLPNDFDSFENTNHRDSRRVESAHHNMTVLDGSNRFPLDFQDNLEDRVPIRGVHDKGVLGSMSNLDERRSVLQDVEDQPSKGTCQQLKREHMILPHTISLLDGISNDSEELIEIGAGDSFARPVSVLDILALPSLRSTSFTGATSESDPDLFIRFNKNQTPMSDTCPSTHSHDDDTGPDEQITDQYRLSGPVPEVFRFAVVVDPHSSSYESLADIVAATRCPDSKPPSPAAMKGTDPGSPPPPLACAPDPNYHGSPRYQRRPRLILEDDEHEGLVERIFSQLLMTCQNARSKQYEI